MSIPFITIVHTENKSKLLILYDTEYYYSQEIPYKQLMWFKNSNIMLNETELILHSKNKKMAIVVAKDSVIYL
jgi:hypothetical protein